MYIAAYHGKESTEEIDTHFSESIKELAQLQQTLDDSQVDHDITTTIGNHTLEYIFVPDMKATGLIFDLHGTDGII